MSDSTTPLLSVSGLSKTFAVRERGLFTRKKRLVKAVTDVSFDLRRGEVLGIVGESGSGKTTLARLVVRLIQPSAGQLRFKGRDLLALDSEETRRVVRPAIRMIFQDPDAVLNPAYTVGTGLAKAIELNRAAGGTNTAADALRTLRELGMGDEFVEKYPDELSGGEKRRLGICRALLTNPDVIVADEPLSGLDVLLQERVLGLLKREQEKRGFALILVSHDLDRVNQVCDRVLVMHSGRVVEDTRLRRDAGSMWEQFQHPYSEMLQRARIEQAVLHVRADGRLSVTTEARTQKESKTPPACSLAAVCPRRLALGNPAVCVETVPLLTRVSPDASVACHFVPSVLAELSPRDERTVSSVPVET